ncbi:kelch-like protein 25 [Styela clava]
MEHKIDVDKNNRMSVVFQELNKMREDSERCDFKILVGSEKILAHRNILSANSKYFEAMFTHNTKEKQSGEVTLVEVDQVCVKKCVDYMYSCEISSPYEKLGDLLHVATMMQLHEICDGIRELLEENLDPESYFVTKKLSSMFILKSLEEKCDEFALVNFEEISKLEDFNDLGQMEVAKMIESKKLKASEEVKLNAVLSWIKFDSDDPSKYANDLIGLVDLCKVFLGYRRHFIENEPLINKSLDLVSRFSISGMDSLNVKPTKVVKQTANAEAIVFSDEISGHLQCFNPTDKSWTQMQEMDQEMKNDFFSAVTAGDFIYVLMKDKSVYRIQYSDNDANWEKMADMLEDHGCCPPAVVYKNWIYVIGGHDHCQKATVEKYDLDLNVWTKCCDKLQPTQYSEVIAFKIYSVGGYSSGRYIDAVDQLDPITGNWTTIGHMTNARWLVSAVELDEGIYVLGGYTQKHRHFNTAEQYNPHDNKWKSLQSMLIPRSWFRTFASQDDIYAVGGCNSYPGSLEKYDIAENKWDMIEIPGGVKLKMRKAVKIQLKNLY